MIKKDTLRFYNAHFESFKVDLINFKADFSSFKRVVNKVKLAYIAQKEQSNTLINHILKSPYKVIICGDFNDTPLSYAYNKIKGDLIDSFAYCGTGIGESFVNIPTLRIDYIMHDQSIMSYNYIKHKKILSDHYAISCDIKL